MDAGMYATKLCTGALSQPKIVVTYTFHLWMAQHGSARVKASLHERETPMWPAQHVYQGTCFQKSLAAVHYAPFHYDLDLQTAVQPLLLVEASTIQSDVPASSHPQS